VAPNTAEVLKFNVVPEQTGELLDAIGVAGPVTVTATVFENVHDPIVAITV
jgi:hypothetical protein